MANFCPQECGKQLCPFKGQTKNILSQKPIIWVLGGPGSGKGTQCEKMIAKYGFTHLSSGDLLREEVKSGSPRAKKLQDIMKQGLLVPNEIVLELLKEGIEKRAASSNGFLIDGFPREQKQGIAFEKAIAPVTKIISFDASNETMLKRIMGRSATSGRADDNEETLKMRLKAFHDEHQLIIKQYPTKVVNINAEREPDVVFKDVEKALDALMKERAAASN